MTWLTMPSYETLKTIYILGAITAQAWFAIKLLLKWTHNVTELVAFTRQLKENDLRHIDLYLKMICKKLDIPYDNLIVERNHENGRVGAL